MSDDLLPRVVAENDYKCVAISCPYCLKKHQHSVGSVGKRTADCGLGEYVLVSLHEGEEPKVEVKTGESSYPVNPLLGRYVKVISRNEYGIVDWINSDGSLHIVLNSFNTCRVFKEDIEKDIVIQKKMIRDP